MVTASNHRWWGLAVLVLPVLLISIDGTVLGFAVPMLSEALEPSSTQLLWIIDIYSFVLAGLLVTMGTLGDRIGRRRLLMIGAAGFTVASLIAAFSTSAAMLIGARALLGVAGSTLMPSTLSLIRNMFTDDRERQTAIAIWATAFAVGSTIGPLVGGFLLEHFWWGSIFVVNVPFTILLLVVAPRLLDESRDPRPGRFDLISATLSIVTMLPFVYALKTFAADGARPVVWITLAVGVFAGVLFVRRQRRLDRPMIDIDLFRLPRFRMAVSGNLLACFGFAGSMYIITQYLQLVVGMSPLAAGVILIPAAVAAASAMMLAPLFARRFGPFVVIAVGLAVGAVGFAMMTGLHVHGSLALSIVSISVLNAGLSAAMTVAVDGILAAVPPERAGSGAAVSETANELGVALGTAILGSILAAVYRPGVDVIAAPRPAIDAARETLGAAVLTAEHLPSEIADALLTGSQVAFVDGMHAAGLTAAIGLALVSVWAAFSARSPRDVPDERRHDGPAVES